MTVRRAGWAVAGGLLLFAGHAPLDQAWSGWVALVPLLALARDTGRGPRPWRAGFGWGFVAGLVFFLPLLTWISRFGIAPWVLLGAVQAVFVAVFVALASWWGEQRGRPVLAVVAWVSLEWARSHVPLQGFPWGVLGYSQHDGGPLLPAARSLGVLGISLLLAMIGVALEAAVAGRVWRQPRALARAVAAILGAVLLGMLVGGSPPPETGEMVDIAGIQGNTIELPPFVDRGNTQRVEDIAALMVETTQALATDERGTPDIVVWPENSLDADPRAVPALAEKVAQAQAAIGDAVLLAGTLLDGPREGTFRNTIVQFAPDGSLTEIYDKRVLVPFGEYVPWRRLLGWLPPLQAIPNDAVPGTEAKVFRVGETVVGPVTCYESIFGRLVRQQVRAGAEVLVVTTNNASFGRSPASRQHLAFSQVRAVETGRWALHAGISGISAVVDPHGRLEQRTELFERAIVRRDLPLLTGQTLYVRLGDVVGPFAALLTLLLVVLAVARRRRV